MEKIPKSNYTQIPNVYFDEIMRKLSGSDNLVLMAIMRKTFGWHKEVDRISYSQIIDVTGLSRGTVATTIKSLEEKELIKIIKKGQNNFYTVNVQEDSPENELVQNLDQSNICTGTSLNFRPDSDKTSLNFRHTKETILNKLDKETITQQPNLSSKLITKETSNNNDSPFKTNTKKNKAKASTTSDSFLKPIEDRYFENYKILHSQKKLQLEKPPYSYAKNRAILSRYKSYDLDLINKVLDEAMNDKWVVDNGYSISHIFAESVFNRLANVKTKDDLMPVKNDCPVCGFPIQGNKCHFCGQGR